MRYLSVLLVTFAFVIYSCAADDKISPEQHCAEVDEWHESRLASLKDERGWLKLAGLYWLDVGEYTFGSSPGNDIVFPEGSIADFAGTIIYYDNNIEVISGDDVYLEVNGEQIDGEFTFHVSDPPEFTHGRLAWTFITRDDLTGLRLFDQESHVYTGFKGIERYPVDRQWRVAARLIPHDEPTTIPIVNILGQTSEQPSPGILRFELQDETHELWAIESGDRLFLIIGDETNRTETFQGGRYMYVDNPGPNKTVIVDFNKAYNPPCAFSEYTTCQLPPPENRLTVAIEAGEKRYNNEPAY